jgi:rRNA maturation protein Nop10
MKLVIHDGPDEYGRYRYTLHWLASYHPGDPAGEYRIAERGQCFHGKLPNNVEVIK